MKHVNKVKMTNLIICVCIALKKSHGKRNLLYIRIKRELKIHYFVKRVYRTILYTDVVIDKIIA